MSKVIRRARGARNQRKGKNGEEIAKLLLRLQGVQMVEKIATPYNVIAKRIIAGAVWLRIVRTEKVSGDIRGIMQDGRRVLCEVKVRDGNLQRSAFEDHQLEALIDNDRWGGVSLVVWVHEQGNLVLRWPLPGFDGGKRASVRYPQMELLQWDGVS